MSKVICPGELLIDFICTDRNALLQDGVNFIKKAGGAPANVAVAIRKMGIESAVLASVGNDQFGDFLINTMKKYNVTTTYINKLPNAHTTLAFVSLSENGERDFNFMRNADSKYSFNSIDSSLLDNADVFHFGSAMAFLEGELKQTYFKLLDYGIKNEKIITFDPNYRDALFGNDKGTFINNSITFIRHSHLVKVSDEELRIITGLDDIEEGVDSLLNIGAKYVLVTLGEKGTLLGSQENIEYVESIPVKMVDATGAGDAFIGAVIAKIAQNLDLSYSSMKEYVQFANKVGAHTVTRIGALDSIPTIDEI